MALTIVPPPTKSQFGEPASAGSVTQVDPPLVDRWVSQTTVEPNTAPARAYGNGPWTSGVLASGMAANAVVGASVRTPTAITGARTRAAIPHDG